MDEFGPLNLQPHPGKQWAPAAAGKGAQDAPRRRRRRATYTRPHGVRHLFAGLDLARDKLYGHVTRRKGRTQFLEFCRYLRSLYPADVRIAIICDNFSPHRSTKTDSRVGDWAEANNVEIAYTPINGSWLNRIEPQFTALRYFTVDGTDHASHRRAGQHDPPLHRLAEPARHRPQAPQGHQAGIDHQAGKGCLTRHSYGGRSVQ